MAKRLMAMMLRHRGATITPRHVSAEVHIQVKRMVLGRFPDQELYISTGVFGTEGGVFTVGKNAGHYFTLDEIDKIHAYIEGAVDALEGVGKQE